MGYYALKTTSQEKRKKRKIKNSHFFSLKARKSKARNFSPLEFDYTNKPFELDNSNVSCFFSAVSEVAEGSPLPLFGLSSHQIEEESIFGVSKYRSS